MKNIISGEAGGELIKSYRALPRAATLRVAREFRSSSSGRAYLVLRGRQAWPGPLGISAVPAAGQAAMPLPARNGKALPSPDGRQPAAHAFPCALRIDKTDDDSPGRAVARHFSRALTTTEQTT